MPRSCWVQHRGSAGQTCHTSASLRRMEADRLLPKLNIYGVGAAWLVPAARSGSPELLQRFPGKDRPRPWEQ